MYMIRKHLILVFIVLASLAGKAQFPFSEKLSSNQYIIKNAVDSALFIVQQNYALKDTETGEMYGRGGNDYFGREFYLAANISENVVIPASIRKPWVKDEAFQSYRDDTTIRPVLSKQTARHVTDTVHNTYGYEDHNKTPLDSLYQKNEMYRTNVSFTAKHIPYIQKATDSTGWMVVAYTETPLRENPNAKAKYYIYKVQPDFSVHDSLAFVEKPKVDNIIGGFWITDSISTGHAHFRIAGMLCNTEEKWYIRNFPVNPVKNTPQNALTRIPNPADSATITFKHKNGFRLKLLEGITIEGIENEFISDKNGKLKVFLGQDTKKHLLKINGTGAKCIQRNRTYTIECKYQRSGENIFVPENTVDDCN